MPKFCCGYCDSPCVRKTLRWQETKRERERLLPEMVGRAGPETDWQDNGLISAREDTSCSILCSSSSCRGCDPSSPKSPGSILPWQDACSPHWRRCQCWALLLLKWCRWVLLLNWGHPWKATCLWCLDFNDETSSWLYDGAHSAWPDWARQIRAEGS